MASHHPIRKQVAPPAAIIPDKLYFRIGDVARLCQVPAYVLRFWETEFAQLKPNKGGTGQRLYRRKDVEIALRIKALLYDQGYTIPGARQVFKAEATFVAELQPEATPFAAEIATDVSQPLAASSFAATSIPAQPVADSTVAPHQLQALHALREELYRLATQLAQPLGAPSSAPALTVVPTPPKPKPLRPSLVGNGSRQALKGTGFSPYIENQTKGGASAPEGAAPKHPSPTPMPFPLIDPRQRDLFAAE